MDLIHERKNAMNPPRGLKGLISAVCLLVSLFLLVTSCKEKSSDHAQQTPLPAVTPVVTVTPPSGPPRLEDCHAQGLGWVPTQDNPQFPGQKVLAHCVGARAPWCCTRDTILRRFTAEASKIQSKWDDPTKMFVSLRLYDCSLVQGFSASGIQRYDLHFAGKGMNGVTEYAVIHLDELSMETGYSGLDTCPPRIETQDQLFNF